MGKGFSHGIRLVFALLLVVPLSAIPCSKEWEALDAKRGTWTNFPRTVTNHPKEIRQPTTTEEVAAIVADASRRGVRVRPLAAGHSWSPVTVTDSVLLSTRGLNQIVGVQKPKAPGEPYLVTAQTGVRIKDISEFLAQNGLTFSNLGQIQYQTLGGVISTNTHGTGVTKTGFVGAVESFKLVDGTGKIHNVSRTENPELFKAALSGLGLVGIITEATMRVEPKFNIEVSTQTYSLTQMTTPYQKPDGTRSTPLQDLITEKEWFHTFWLPRTDTLVAQTGDRTEKPAKPAPLAPTIEWATRIGVVNPFTKLTTLFPGTFARFQPALGRLTQWAVRPKKVVKPNTEAFTSLIEPKDWAYGEVTEFYLPRELTDAALLRLKKMYDDLHKEGIDPVAPFLWLRFVKGDDTYLSPSSNTGNHREWVAINIYDIKDKVILQKAREALAELVPDRPDLLRVHLGKTHVEPPETILTRNPNWDAFDRVRRQMDPNGTLLSPWSERLVSSSPQ